MLNNNLQVGLLEILKSIFGDNYSYEEISIPKEAMVFTFLEDKPYKVDHISTLIFPKRIRLDLYSERKLGNDGSYLLYDSCEDHKVVYYGFINH